VACPKDLTDFAAVYFLLLPGDIPAVVQYDRGRDKNREMEREKERERERKRERERRVAENKGLLLHSFKCRAREVKG